MVKPVEFSKRVDPRKQQHEHDDGRDRVAQRLPIDAVSLSAGVRELAGPLLRTVRLQQAELEAERDAPLVDRAQVAATLANSLAELATVAGVCSLSPDAHDAADAHERAPMT